MSTCSSCDESPERLDRLERLKRNRLGLADKFSVDEVRDVLIQLCLGLDHFHQLGLIHRDIKPGNIMIAPDGHTSIMDFELLKKAMSTLTKTDGYCTYVAPERAQVGRQVLKRTLFSRHCRLRMLTGEQPFRGTPFSLVLSCQGAAAAIAERRDDLDQVLRHHLQSHREKPEDRYKSAREMADALKALTLVEMSNGPQSNVADQPASVAPETPPPPPPGRASGALVSSPSLDEPVMQSPSMALDMMDMAVPKSGLPANRPSIFKREADPGTSGPASATPADDTKLTSHYRFDTIGGES